MPRVRYYRKEYAVSDFCKWLNGQLKMNGYKQADVADWLEITQQAVSKKMRSGNFDLKELITIFAQLDTDQTEIGRILKIKTEYRTRK